MALPFETVPIVPAPSHENTYGFTACHAPTSTPPPLRKKNVASSLFSVCFVMAEVMKRPKKTLLEEERKGALSVRGAQFQFVTCIYNSAVKGNYTS